MACLALPACQAGRQPTAALRTGDLLFQDTDGGPLADAIRAVTWGVDGAKFTHVGILFFDHGQPMVVEAGGAGVKTTTLAKFLARAHDERGRPRVVVGRLADRHQAAAAPAVERALALVGRPYNDEFVLGNGKYYCSQLVYETYVAAPGGNTASAATSTGEHLFDTPPMTFRQPGAAEPLPAWKSYFATRNMPIPEGKPGCNPGGLSRSDNVRIIAAFGRPTGWTEALCRKYPNPTTRPSISGQ